MAEIPLSRGLVALVDDEDYPSLIEISWHAQRGGREMSNFYAKHCQHISGSGAARKHIFVSMHRLIVGAGPGEIVDHANRNTLDNRRSNLRICSLSQNSANSVRRKRSATAATTFRGIHWHLRDRKWRVQICVQSKHIWIGEFRDEIEAALAYDTAAKQYFGEFAVLNFPVHSSAPNAIEFARSAQQWKPQERGCAP